jgi:hypothetical protein
MAKCPWCHALRSVSLAVAALLVSGCSQAPDGPGEDADPLSGAPWLNSTLEAGWSLWLNYNIYNTTALPFDWIVAEGEAVQFTVYRTKSTGEDVLYTSTAANDTGSVTARHPNIHALVWRNINADNVTIQIRVSEGYAGARYQPGADPAKSNCPTPCMQA